eukprot:3226654-Prymnesium_polylepis.1
MPVDRRIDAVGKSRPKAASMKPSAPDESGQPPRAATLPVPNDEPSAGSGLAAAEEPSDRLARLADDGSTQRPAASNAATASEGGSPAATSASESARESRPVGATIAASSRIGSAPSLGLATTTQHVASRSTTRVRCPLQRIGRSM